MQRGEQAGGAVGLHKGREMGRMERMGCRMGKRRDTWGWRGPRVCAICPFRIPKMPRRIVLVRLGVMRLVGVTMGKMSTLMDMLSR